MSDTTLTIYGTSDDLIEIEGAVTEEFNVLGEDTSLLTFGDGTALRVSYTHVGVWRITVAATGTAEVTIIPALEGGEDNYSDRATLTGDVPWIAHGNDFVAVKAAAAAEPDPMTVLTVRDDHGETLTVEPQKNGRGLIVAVTSAEGDYDLTVRVSPGQWRRLVSGGDALLSVSGVSP